MTTVWTALLIETVVALAIGAALAVWARRLRPRADRDFDRMIAREFGPGFRPALDGESPGGEHPGGGREPGREPGPELSRD